MTNKNVTVNYNGEPLKADEVLVFTPYDEEDVKNNVTNKESIVTITKAGKSVKAVLKAVPKEFEAEAKAQFNSWQREQLPQPTEGRCMIPQPDGTYKECPKKNGDNRVSCTNCPNKGKYKRKLIAKVSIDEQEDENGFTLVESPAADQAIIEEENLTEAQQRIVAKFEAMIIPPEFGEKETAKIWFHIADLKEENTIRASMLWFRQTGTNVKEAISNGQCHFGYAFVPDEE